MADRYDENKKLEEHKKRKREIYSHSGNFSPTEVIESGKAKKYSTSREIRITLVVIAAVLVLFALFFVIVRFGFRVKTVEVTNKTDFYEQQVIEASGIGKGTSFFFSDTDEIAQNVARSVPYAGNIKVKKVFPSRIVISLEKVPGKFYVSSGGEYYVLDESLTVLAKTDNASEVELMNCIHLRSKEISKCVQGEKVEFHDPDISGVLDELFGLLNENALMGFCGQINIDSKFDIRFTYLERYTVKLGDLRDLTVKISLLTEIINELPMGSGGEIDVSDKNLKKAIFSPVG